MTAGRRRNGQRGFTLVEAVVTVAISALAASMFFGTHFAIHRQSKFITDSIRNRRDAQNALHRVVREMSEVTHVESAGSQSLLVRRDYNFPRTPGTWADDTLGTITFDPATGSIVSIDDIESPWPRTVAQGVENLQITVIGNLVDFQMTVRNGEDTGETRVRTSFVVRNNPR